LKLKYLKVVPRYGLRMSREGFLIFSPYIVFLNILRYKTF
jgi:hypothetical protein